MRIEARRRFLGCDLRLYDDFDSAVEGGSSCFVLPDVIVKLSQRFVVVSRAGMRSAMQLCWRI